ncbi:hypothetical protein ACQ4PT_062275 [Festuca glaucescens]
MEFMAIPSPSVSPNPAFKILVQGKQGSSAGGHLKAAVLEPSVFVLEEFNAEEWIQVERKRRSKVLGRPSMPVPRHRRQTLVSSDRASKGNFKFPFPVLRARHEAQNQLEQAKEVLGHKGRKKYNPNLLLSTEPGQRKICQPSRKPMQRVLGLAWSKTSRLHSNPRFTSPPVARSPSETAMVGRGGTNYPPGQGGGGAGSGAPPPNMTQNSQFPRQNSQFERGGGSGYGNGGNGYGQFNQQNFNNNVNGSRGTQGFPPSDRNSGPGFNTGNSQYRGGGRWYQNDAWQGDQGGYDPASFGGDFGNFNEGYSDGGQGYGQNFNGNVYGGTQRGQRQYHNPGQGGRGRGGRGGRGRFNGCGTGGRVPTVQSGQEVMAANMEQSALAVTPQVQQVAHAVATVQPAVTAHALKQVLQGIQHQNITQGVTAGNEVATLNSESVKGAKKKDKLADIICFKCDGSGHYVVDCQAVLCLFCDSAKHASDDCPKHDMPKPTAVMYGLCRDDLLFFDIPKSAEVKSKRDSGKNGRIRVKGGSMTVHQIIKELTFFIPGNHQWDITQTEENLFSVVYPSKADKARLRKINDIKVDESGCTMFFEEGTDQNLDSWRIREAWVRVSGCPKELRDDYLALFAVGSLIGKTKQVDMEFTH